MIGSCSAEPRGTPINTDSVVKKASQDFGLVEREVSRLYGFFQPLAHIASGYTHKLFRFPTLSAGQIVHVPAKR